jgi:hypothetical protein
MQLAEAGAAGREVPGTVLTLRALADSFGTRSRRFETAVTRRVVPGILQQGPHNSLWDHQTAALKAVKAGEADGTERAIVAAISESRALSCRPCRFNGAIAAASRLVTQPFGSAKKGAKVPNQRSRKS